jgi:hypothetical protein
LSERCFMRRWHRWFYVQLCWWIHGSRLRNRSVTWCQSFLSNGILLLFVCSTFMMYTTGCKDIIQRCTHGTCLVSKKPYGRENVTSALPPSVCHYRGLPRLASSSSHRIYTCTELMFAVLRPLYVLPKVLTTTATKTVLSYFYINLKNVMAFASCG